VSVGQGRLGMCVVGFVDMGAIDQEGRIMQCFCSPRRACSLSAASGCLSCQLTVCHVIT
jgi:hypothetical protein